MAAPGVLLTGLDGQLRPGGVSGWYVGDTRLLDRWEVSVDGSDLDVVRAENTGTARHAYSYLARGIGDLSTADPTVRIDRVRVLDADGVSEELTIESTGGVPLEVVLRMDLGTDLAPMPEIKQGRAGPRVQASSVPDGLEWERPRAGCASRRRGPEVDPATGRLTWRLTVARGSAQTVSLRASTSVPGLFGSGRPAGWSTQVEAGDVRLERVVRQGLADLEGLLLRDAGDRFLAAGSPWFLTLFGRDSLWAARLLMPLDPGLALSTLRTLARRQGRVDDPATEEQPGKILHEVRRETMDLGTQRLPPVYYGSVDATPLFVCALADAAEWGADPEQVRELVPAARRCLEWMLAQSSASGWLTYIDHTGEGLSNQGWKDSHDGVQFADGRLAEPPISLSEVQAYAYDAAVRGAALLAELRHRSGAGARGVGHRPACEVRARLLGRGPRRRPHAIALDKHGERVDSVTSNMGHLLGTGVLEPAATSRVAALLTDERLDSGFGLRTLSAASPRFSRLSYHGGTVWPHDTAIAVRGLAAEGRFDEAGRSRPDWCGPRRPSTTGCPSSTAATRPADVDRPSAYPAACRPQAWSAAAPFACLVALSGVRVDAAPSR